MFLKLIFIIYFLKIQCWHSSVTVCLVPVYWAALPSEVRTISLALPREEKNYYTNLPGIFFLILSQILLFSVLSGFHSQHYQVSTRVSVLIFTRNCLWRQHSLLVLISAGASTPNSGKWRHELREFQTKYFAPSLFM